MKYRIIQTVTTVRDKSWPEFHIERLEDGRWSGVSSGMLSTYCTFKQALTQVEELIAWDNKKIDISVVYET